MYTALYREYRPEVFEEMLGQEHIVKILKNQIETDSVSHAYLFCGTRGTGKTTTARILAKGLNCVGEGSRPCGVCSVCQSIKDGTFLDVVEIDAASNNGVDNIRELRESVKYPPAAGKKKVYIIDEVHMLSSGAFNALLKTLEEPPEYVVFILATTEPQKLPSTILSRCMRLDFKRVPEATLVEGMMAICEKKGVQISPAALKIIAANSDGSVRDGLSILDQCISGAEKQIEAKDVLEFLGASGEETFVELTDFVTKGRTADALIVLGKALADGKDVRQFMRDWINHYRNLLMTKFMKNPQDVVGMSVENIDRIRRQSESVDLAQINRGILELSKTMNEARWSTQPRILLELAVVKLSDHIQRTGVASAVAEQSSAAEVSTAEVKKMPAVKAAGEEMEPVKRRGKLQEDRQAVSTEGSSATMEQSTEAPEREPKSDAAEAFDLDAIWNGVFEDGEAMKGSFYIIGSGAVLQEIGEDTFTVVVKSDLIKNHAEKNRQLLEELMEKHTGKRRGMILRLATEKETTEKRSVEEIARDAGNLLGIDVEIE